MNNIGDRNKEDNGFIFINSSEAKIWHSCIHEQKFAVATLKLISSTFRYFVYMDDLDKQNTVSSWK
jgi:hypothetical protein